MANGNGNGNGRKKGRKKVVFTDEWGGGTSPMCQANSMMEMGGNTILSIDGTKKYTQHAYFKIPKPLRGTAMWIAIHDATVANGTMRSSPRS